MHSDKVAFYILDLLQQVPSVHVPGLGRFDAIFHPAVIDVQQSTVTPPHVEPGFSPEALEAGDLLPAYIHYVSGIDKQSAAALIETFVTGIRNSITNGEPVSIEKFGTFSNSPLGTVHFTPDWDAFNLSFNGLAVIDLSPVHSYGQAETQIPVAEYNPPPVTYTPPVKEEPVTRLEPVVERPAESNWVTDRENVETVTPITVVAPAQPVISDSTSRLWWTILVSALVLITILCAYLAWDIFSNKEKINQYTVITSDELADQSPDIILVDTLEVTEEALPVQDTPAVDDPVEPTAPAPVQEVGNCRIVVGAFSDPRNVTRMEERLLEMGYPYERITNGALTKVAIITDCDRAILQKTLTEARSSISPEAWIY